MTQFLFMPIWIGVMALVGANRSSSLYEKTTVSNASPRPRLLFAALVFLPILWCAVWERPIADTWAYIGCYKSLAFSMRKGLWDYLTLCDKEPGFAIFSYLVYFFTDGSVFAFRTLIGLIHIVPVVLIYRRYSCNYVLSAFLFVASGTYVGWMMNGLRQFMAVTMIFAATPLLVRRKFFPVICIIIFASCFHFSALIMLPIIFIVHGRAFNPRTMLYVFGAVLCTALFAQDDSLYAETMNMTQYGKSVQLLRGMGDNGTNMLRVMVSAVPVVLAWLGRKKIQETGDVFLNICVNMSVITFGIYLVSAVTSGIMIGRLPIYTGLYGQILLPWLVGKLYDRGTSATLTFLMVLFYLCYYPVELGGRLFK